METLKQPDQQHLPFAAKPISTANSRAKAESSENDHEAKGKPREFGRELTNGSTLTCFSL